MIFTRVGIYIRVSTDEQAKEGYSIDAQKKLLNAWAVVKGATEITEYIDEGKSAKNLRRPAIQRMMQDCKDRKLDVVIVWKLDRLARNLRDQITLVEDVFRANGIDFVSSTESFDTSTSSGRLVMNMLGAVAQNERENTSDRVKMVMTEMSRTGRHMAGKPLYGFSVDSEHNYVINEKEADAVRMMFRMRAAGEGYGHIIKALCDAGHFTRKGQPFKKNTIYDMIRNPRYRGVCIYNRAESRSNSGSRNNRACKPADQIVYVENGCPAIVTDREWEAANMTGENKKAVGGMLRAKNTYLLSGMIICGCCSRKMIIHNAGKDRHGGYYRVYKCPECKTSINYLEAEEVVLGHIEHVASNPDILDVAVHIANNAVEAEAEDAREELRPMYERRDQLKKEYANLMAFARKMGEDGFDMCGEEIKKLNAEITLLEGDISRLQKNIRTIDVKVMKDAVARFINIRKQPKNEQRAQVRQLIKAVTVYPERIDVGYATNASGDSSLSCAAIVASVILSIPHVLKQGRE